MTTSGLLADEFLNGSSSMVSKSPLQQSSTLAPKSSYLKPKATNPTSYEDTRATLSKGAPPVFDYSQQ